MMTFLNRRHLPIIKIIVAVSAVWLTILILIATDDERAQDREYIPLILEREPESTPNQTLNPIDAEKLYRLRLRATLEPEEARAALRGIGDFVDFLDPGIIDDWSKPPKNKKKLSTIPTTAVEEKEENLVEQPEIKIDEEDESAKLKIDAKDESENKPEPEFVPETESEPQAEPEPESEPEPAPEPDAEYESKPETEYVPGPVEEYVGYDEEESVPGLLEENLSDGKAIQTENKINNPPKISSSKATEVKNENATKDNIKVQITKPLEKVDPSPTKPLDSKLKPKA